jgi:DNA (cytosine-5)-methyltransferase 1
MVGRDPNNPSSRAPHCVWEKVADELKQMAAEARKEPIEVTINEHGSLRPHRMDKAKTGISEFQVENEDNTASTLISARPNKTYGYTTSYRIRKLTPRECFRLMGVTEADIDKIQQSGVSQSQQYKMAGNSIVVDCLYHMFRKMFTETACESQQLSLF